MKCEDLSTIAPKGRPTASRTHGFRGDTFEKGRDPGIRTNMAFRPSDSVGVIVIANRGHVEFDAITDRLYQAASRW